MGRSEGPAPEIELLVAGGGSDQTRDELRPGRWKSLGLLAAVLIGGVFLVRATSTPVERPERVVPREQEPRSTRGVAVAPPTTTEPSREHPAYLIGVPGPDIPVVSDIRGMSLLYVSTFGHPTLVDLGTGTRSELHVSDEWFRYSFMVELGRVVTGDPAERSRTPAGDRALPIVAYRSPAPSTTAPAPRIEPDANVVALCLDGDCRLPAPRETLGRGVDSVRPLDAEVDSVIAELFDPAVWPREGHWMLAPAGSGLDYRLPAPAAHATIWVIHQPSG